MSKTRFINSSSIKIKTFASVLALFLLSLAAAPLTSAQTAGQSAAGKYQFMLPDGYTKYVEFDAKNQDDGTTTGQVFFSDEAPLTDQDVDGTGDRTLDETYKGAYFKATLDGLTVNKNQSVMSGTITDSSIPGLVGQRVLLTVEDNGDNSKVPDKLTWGIYRPVEKGWTPTDAEREKDEGAGMKWTASDAERKDDPGVVYPMDPTITSQSFEFSAYDFADVERGAGDIQVNP